MLSAHNYVIEEDFIYVGKNTSDIFLTYIPLRHLEQQIDIKEKLYLLVKKLVSYTHNENKHLQEIIDYF